MDPKGYFLIAVDKKKKFIRVGYCKFTRLGNSPINDMTAVIKGKWNFKEYKKELYEIFYDKKFNIFSYYLTKLKF